MMRARTTIDRWGPSPATVWLVVALLTLALRLPDIGNPLIDLDEQFYLLVGDRLLHGALPYVDIWDRKPVGLFLLYAAARSLGGDPWVGYQLLATAFAIATAGLIATLTRRVARGWAPVAAGAIYLVWVGFQGGRGGQSPIFYDAFIAAAALATMAAIDRPDRSWRYGPVAMVLCGLALQIKPTVVFEGGWFGLTLLFVAWRGSFGMPRLALYAVALVGIALAPSALAYATYVTLGHGAAWWFANVESIFQRGFAPTEPMGGRITGIALMLLVPLGAALIGAMRSHGPARLFLLGWLVMAIVGFLAIPPYYNHYALPLLVPLAVLAGVGVGANRMLALITAGSAVLLLWLVGYPHGGERAQARATLARLATTVDRYRAGGCLFDFASVPALYVATGACTRSRYVFAPHLMLATEAPAIGVDQLAEVRRILATRPPVIVTGPPLPGLARPPVAAVAQALARDYRRVDATSGYTVYARRDTVMPRPAGNP